MKKFLIIEYDDHDNVHHLIEAPNLKKAFDSLCIRMHIEESLASAYTEEAFPPTRNGKSILSHKHYMPQFLGVYEVIQEIPSGTVKSTLEDYTQEVFDIAVAAETAKRDAR